MSSQDLPTAQAPVSNTSVSEPINEPSNETNVAAPESEPAENSDPFAGEQTWSFANLTIAAAAPEQEQEQAIVGEMGLVNDDIIRVDAPRHVNPLFPRHHGQVANPAPLLPSPSGVVASFSDVVAGVVAGGAAAGEEWEGEEEGGEEEEEEEVGPEGVDLNEIDPPVAVRVRAGLAQLSEVSAEVDVLDVAIPRGEFRGHPAAVRARAELLFAQQEIRAAVGMLWGSLVDARGVAADARERVGATQGEALRVAAELINFQIQAGTWRERALSSEALLREAELEIASLRAQLGEEDDE